MTESKIAEKAFRSRRHLGWVLKSKQEYLGKESVRNSRKKKLVMSIGPEAWKFIAYLGKRWN